VSQRLKGLDQKVGSLQSARSTAYGTSLAATNSIAERLRIIQDMTLQMKDLQIWCQELDAVTDKETLEVMGLKAKGAALMADSYGQIIFKSGQEKNGQFAESVKGLGDAGERLVALRTSLVANAAPEVRKKYDDLKKDMLTIIRMALVLIENEGKNVGE